MDIQEQYMEDYNEGFNDCAIIHDHAPEILNDFAPENNPQTDYFLGFFDAVDYYQEQALNKDLEDLETLRSQSREKDIEHERE